MIEPAERPQLDRTYAGHLLLSYGTPISGPAILGRRGYFQNTMGHGVNSRGIYDDALFLITPLVYRGYNANTDPSLSRPGMAVLKTGVWDYKLGIHNISKDPALHPHYPALVQAGPVTVARDGGKVETGYFGINIHKGGVNTTSSEGCQTIVPEQWEEFIQTVTAEMLRLKLATIPYVLTDRTDV